MKNLIFVFVLFFAACSQKESSVEAKATIAQLSEQLLEHPTDTHLLQLRKQFFLNKGNTAAALLDQKKIVALDSLNCELLFEQAMMEYTLAEAGDPNYYRAALASLSKDLEEQEVHLPSMLLRGELNYLYKKHEASLKDLNTVLKGNPYLVKAYFYKGLNFKELGDTGRAIAQFQTVVEQDPNHQDAYEHLALLHAAQGSPLAGFYFDNALAVDSSVLQLWYNKGMYLQNKGDVKEARECYSAILRRDAYHPLAHYNMGYLFYLEKKYGMAADHFAEVIYTDPNYAAAFFSRGLCFKAMGNPAQAKFDFENALRLDPNMLEAQAEIEKLK